MNNTINPNVQNWARNALLLLVVGVLIVTVSYLLWDRGTIQLTDKVPFLTTQSTDGNEESVTVDANTDLSSQAGGILIDGILPGSPASNTALNPGDIILAVDGQPVSESTDLAKLIASYAPGQTVTLQVETPGFVVYELPITLSEHSENKGSAFLGVAYQAAENNSAIPSDDSRSGAVLRFSNQAISETELTQLATFAVLWPQNLPSGYSLENIYEMRQISSEANNGTGIFVFEYINDKDRGKHPTDQGRLFIWQYDKTTQSLPGYADRAVVGELTLEDGREIPLIESDEGNALRAFFAQGNVNIEVEAYNTPIGDIEQIVSSLASK